MNTSIIEFRPDFAAIAAWIPQGSSVLDLGCGDGSLLRYLRETREVRGYGVEINDQNIAACIANNVNVLQFLLSRETTLDGLLRMARRKTRKPAALLVQESA